MFRRLIGRSRVDPAWDAAFARIGARRVTAPKPPPTWTVPEGPRTITIMPDFANHSVDLRIDADPATGPARTRLAAIWNVDDSGTATAEVLSTEAGLEGVRVALEAAFAPLIAVGAISAFAQDGDVTLVLPYPEGATPAAIADRIAAVIPHMPALLAATTTALRAASLP